VVSPEQPSSHRHSGAKAPARLFKHGGPSGKPKKRGVKKNGEAMPAAGDTSDRAALALLKRIKATNDQTEIRHLTDQLQLVIFHKQYKNIGA
jgi:hypothetical protein